MRMLGNGSKLFLLLKSLIKKLMRNLKNAPKKLTVVTTAPKNIETREFYGKNNWRLMTKKVKSMLPFEGDKVHQIFNTSLDFMYWVSSNLAFVVCFLIVSTLVISGLNMLLKVFWDEFINHIIDFVSQITDRYSQRNSSAYRSMKKSKWY